MELIVVELGVVKMVGIAYRNRALGNELRYSVFQPSRSTSTLKMTWAALTLETHLLRVSP
jgi:hypothetical protein